MANSTSMHGSPDQPTWRVLASDANTLTSRAGRPVNVSGVVWRVPDPIAPASLDWRQVKIPSASVMEATTAYMKYLIRNYATGSVRISWYALQRMWVSPAFQM